MKGRYRTQSLHRSVAATLSHLPFSTHTSDGYDLDCSGGPNDGSIAVRYVTVSAVTEEWMLRTYEHLLEKGYVCEVVPFGWYNGVEGPNERRIHGPAYTIRVYGKDGDDRYKA